MVSVAGCEVSPVVRMGKGVAWEGGLMGFG